MSKLEQKYGRVYTAEVELSRVTAHGLNYNEHPDAQIEALRESLRRWSYVRLAVLHEAEHEGGQYRIVAGEGIVTAARAEGVDSLEFRIFPAAWPEHEVVAYLVADNELARGSRADAIKLERIKTLLRAQREQAALMRAAGFSPAEIGDLDERVEAIVEQATASESRARDTAERLVDKQQQARDDEGNEGAARLAALPTSPTPDLVVETGDVWRLGDKHTLVVLPVATAWPTWVDLLCEESRSTILSPYVGPAVFEGDTAHEPARFIVQPEREVAAHIVEYYVARHGDGSAVRVAQQQRDE